MNAGDREGWKKAQSGALQIKATDAPKVSVVAGYST